MVDHRISSADAGYMELTNARKDADCKKVRVRGGISLALACCNRFEPDGAHVQSFKCGTCEYRIMEKPCAN